MVAADQNYKKILAELKPAKVQLLAVSKKKPVGDIKALYNLGQRDFGENYVQEMTEKQMLLPKDIRWHFIGHLQSNKIKYIAPFVYMIQGVDSHKLLLEIDKQARKNQRIINCLLQVHIALEETKFGFSEEELEALVDAIGKYHLMKQLENVKIAGLMGMASNTGNQLEIRKEFVYMRALYKEAQAALGADSFNILSMGMSGDYKIAIEEGSNMVRIGSLLFGERI
jgi:PLP dependent protein